MKENFCPVNAWDCPYWKDGGLCTMEEDELNPMDECDDFAFYWDSDDDYWEEESPNQS